ncbi:MAG: hypothetical protein JRE16_00415 [Deltaproteobacteria bacterium]|jgi:hypothetical protein|nr:hypothetical protein [Deltaproteobacteria bacterium]
MDFPKALDKPASMFADPAEFYNLLGEKERKNQYFLQCDTMLENVRLLQWRTWPEVHRMGWMVG